MKKLEELEPRALWSIFDKLTKTPRPSKHEAAAMDFVYNFGIEHGLEAERTKAGNVILRKAATPGCENWPVICLQGHGDMVPQKSSDSNHDFLKDPIPVVVGEEWVGTDGTTLGADNGIGVSAALALITDETVKHGPLEVLVTFDEETSMGGATALRAGELKADILLNLDSETEGEMYVGCAGGVDVTATFEVSTEKTAPEDIAYKVKIEGGHGGHSGMDIHLGVCNANKQLARFLKFTAANYETMLADIQGGTLRNAIPRDAEAIVTLCPDDEEDFEDTVAEFNDLLRSEYKTTDPDIRFVAERVATPAEVFTEMDADDIINALNGSPNGIIRMSADVEGLVQTSLNMAQIVYKDGKVSVHFLLRGLVETEKEDLSSSLESLFRLAGAKVTMSGDYPGWRPNVESRILAHCKRVYADMYGREPKVVAVHAGLECGIIGCQYPKLDMISFGPTIQHPHSPAERVNIASVGRFYEYLKKVVEIG